MYFSGSHGWRCSGWCRRTHKGCVKWSTQRKQSMGIPPYSCGGNGGCCNSCHTRRSAHGRICESFYIYHMASVLVDPRHKRNPMAPVHLELRHKRNSMVSGNNRGQKGYLLASPQYASVPDLRQNEENNRNKKSLLHWCACEAMYLKYVSAFVVVKLNIFLRTLSQLKYPSTFTGVK